MAKKKDKEQKMVEIILWNYINETKNKIPTLTDEAQNE